MIICVYRRFIQNFCSRKDLYVTLCRKETTSLMKTRNDVQEQWEKKMKLYMKTYEDLFGITKLTEMHERVLEVSKLGSLLKYVMIKYCGRYLKFNK